MFPLLQQTAEPLVPWQFWTLIGLGIMGVIYLRVLRPMFRRPDPLDKSTPGFASLSKQRVVERQMQNLLVELSEMARQINAQIDTRAAKLEVLIQQADERIATLSANRDEPRPIQANSSNPPSPVEQMPDPRHAEVYSLADKGRDAQQIAAQLGRPRGEVELILALRSKS